MLDEQTQKTHSGRPENAGGIAQAAPEGVRTTLADAHGAISGLIERADQAALNREESRRRELDRADREAAKAARELREKFESSIQVRAFNGLPGAVFHASPTSQARVVEGDGFYLDTLNVLGEVVTKKMEVEFAHNRNFPKIQGFTEGDVVRIVLQTRALVNMRTQDFRIMTVRPRTAPGGYAWTRNAIVEVDEKTAWCGSTLTTKNSIPTWMPAGS